MICLIRGMFNFRVVIDVVIKIGVFLSLKSRRVFFFLVWSRFL